MLGKPPLHQRGLSGLSAEGKEPEQGTPRRCSPFTLLPVSQGWSCWTASWPGRFMSTLVGTPIRVHTGVICSRRVFPACETQGAKRLKRSPGRPAGASWARC